MEGDLKAIQRFCDLTEIPVFIKRLSGGDINEVFCVEVGNQKWVVKKNERDRFPEMLYKEGRALNYFNQHVPDRYPKVISNFETREHQYLLLEYVETGANSGIGQENLGMALAIQHQISAESCGWEEDNFIGSLPQPNPRISKWSDFYAEHRLLFQTKRAYDQGLVARSFTRRMEKFCGYLDELFPKEPHALLHGDLWGGNYFIQPNDNPLLYDPAVYFGHREIDIAMTQLFGGFSAAFYQAYNASYPLVDGWEERIEYGQLYPNLVHLNLFGPVYMQPVRSVIDQFQGF